MNLSYNWLKTYIDTTLSPREVADALTQLGLEVGKIEQIGGAPEHLAGVVVGQVQKVVPHPNADRLRICQVDVGAEAPLSIVCGAPNVAEGQKVPVATVGTTLKPFGKDESFKIKKGKIRGEVSLGMICAEDELGLGEGHEGIMVLDESLVPGTPFADTLDLEQDFILEIDLTPNRVDGASHFGAARDLGAYLRQRAKLPEISLDKSQLSGPNPIPVTIADEGRCKRYCSVYLEGVTVGESPEWLQNRLRSVGLRPINNVVDITNFVLHELGHPLHAFDADELKGRQVIVRTMDEDTPFVTLDEVEQPLKAGEDLMICDAERPLCIGGVMGGLNSGVTEKTQNIFLESAYFDPGTVRRTAKRLGLSTDSSFRFERGTDPHMAPIAAMRAASLIVELAGGKASQLSDVKLAEFLPFAVDLSLRKFARITGKDLGKATVLDLLNSLEIRVVEDPDGDTLHLEVPPYRVDVQRDVDVMEDLLRVYGYNNIETPAAIHASVDFEPYFDRNALKEKFADHLSANGFYEIMNNSLVSATLGDEQAVHLVNPLSEDLGILRPTLLHGLLESIAYNQNRQNEDLAFYEFGKTYAHGKGGYEEQQWLAMALTGQQQPTHWASEPQAVTLQSMTREVERIERWFAFTGERVETTHPEFEYGLDLVHDGAVVLRYGKVNNDLAARYDLRNEVFYLIADWPALVARHRGFHPRFQEIPLYPAIRRDLSLLIDQAVSFDQMRQAIQQANPKLIRSVELHDVYRGKGVPEGKKSYLVSIELRDDSKTLADKAAEKVMGRVVQLLAEQTGAEVRK